MGAMAATLRQQFSQLASNQKKEQEMKYYGYFADNKKMHGLSSLLLNLTHQKTHFNLRWKNKSGSLRNLIFPGRNKKKKKKHLCGCGKLPETHGFRFGSLGSASDLMLKQPSCHVQNADPCPTKNIIRTCCHASNYQNCLICRIWVFLHHDQHCLPSRKLFRIWTNSTIRARNFVQRLEVTGNSIWSPLANLVIFRQTTGDWNWHRSKFRYCTDGSTKPKHATIPGMFYDFDDLRMRNCVEFLLYQLNGAWLLRMRWMYWIGSILAATTFCVDVLIMEVNKLSTRFGKLVVGRQKCEELVLHPSFLKCWQTRKSVLMQDCCIQILTMFGLSSVGTFEPLHQRDTATCSGEMKHMDSTRIPDMKSNLHGLCYFMLRKMRKQHASTDKSNGFLLIVIQ